MYGLGSLRHRPGRPGDHHNSENYPLFQPIISNFASFALSAPRNLPAYMGSVCRQHLKDSFGGQNPTLNPALPLILESSDPWSTVLLTMDLESLRRPEQPSLVSQQLRASLDADFGVLGHGVHGAEPGLGDGWEPMWVCSGHFQTAHVPARRVPPHRTHRVLCLLPRTLNQFCQLLNYFNFFLLSPNPSNIFYT